METKQIERSVFLFLDTREFLPLLTCLSKQIGYSKEEILTLAKNPKKQSIIDNKTQPYCNFKKKKKKKKERQTVFCNWSWLMEIKKKVLTNEQFLPLTLNLNTYR